NVTSLRAASNPSQLTLINNANLSVNWFDSKNAVYPYGSNTANKTGITKQSVSWNATNITVVQDGVVIGDSYTPAIPLEPIDQYHWSISGTPITQLIKGITMFNTKLTDQELIELTQP
ncbi:unnamed protein product, partial [marine sediment metagenome]